jgi:hypothetical protein
MVKEVVKEISKETVLTRLEELEAEKNVIAEKFNNIESQIQQITTEGNQRLTQLNKIKQDLVMEFKFVEGKISEHTLVAGSKVEHTTDGEILPRLDNKELKNDKHN